MRDIMRDILRIVKNEDYIYKNIKNIDFEIMFHHKQY